MKVGDMVRNKIHPQRVWLVTKIAPDGLWFIGDGYKPTNANVWRSVNEYEAISNESR